MNQLCPVQVRHATKRCRCRRCRCRSAPSRIERPWFRGCDNGSSRGPLDGCVDGYPPVVPTWQWKNPSFISDFPRVPYKKGGFSIARLVYPRVMMVDDSLNDASVRLIDDYSNNGYPPVN